MMDANTYSRIRQLQATTTELINAVNRHLSPGSGADADYYARRSALVTASRRARAAELDIIALLRDHQATLDAEEQATQDKLGSMLGGGSFAASLLTDNPTGPTPVNDVIDPTGGPTHSPAQRLALETTRRTPAGEPYWQYVKCDGVMHQGIPLTRDIAQLLQPGDVLIHYHRPRDPDLHTIFRPVQITSQAVELINEQQHCHLLPYSNTYLSFGPNGIPASPIQGETVTMPYFDEETPAIDPASIRGVIFDPSNKPDADALARAKQHRDKVANMSEADKAALATPNADLSRFRPAIEQTGLSLEQVNSIVKMESDARDTAIANELRVCCEILSAEHRKLDYQVGDVRPAALAGRLESIRHEINRVRATLAVIINNQLKQ